MKQKWVLLIIFIVGSLSSALVINDYIRTRYASSQHIEAGVKPLTVVCKAVVEVGEPLIITVTSDGEPIENAKITIDNLTTETDSNGKATIILHKEGSNIGKIVKEGYNEETFVVRVIKPEKILTKPNPLKLSGPSITGIGEEVQFIVTSNGTAVENVTVAVDNQTQETDVSGNVFFTLNTTGSYTFKAFKEGYLPSSLKIKVVAIPIRGLFLGGAPPSALLEKANEMGVNYVQIVYWIEVLKNGTILPDKYSPVGCSKSEIISLIQKANKAGFKIYLQLYPEFYGTQGAHVGELEMGPVADQQLFMEEMKRKAIEWAEVAEDLDIELYSPSCELNVFIDWSNNMEWHKQILPEIRKVYHGELVQKGELVWEKYGLYPEGELSFYDHYEGWDYVNSDIFERAGGTMSFEDYRTYVNETIMYLMELKDKHGAKGIILGEIGIPEGENSVAHFRDMCGLNSEEYIFMFWKILFEEAKGNVGGFFFWPWYEHRNIRELITSYYCDLNESYRKDVLLMRFKDEAIQALNNSKACLESLSNYSQPAYEGIRREFIKAEEAFNAGEYIIAKYRANIIKNKIGNLTISAIGIIIDGYDDDWTSIYEPLVVDEKGDVSNKGEDLKALYMANDQENLYFMIQFVGEPEADVVFFFDIDFDGKWDYDIRASPRFGTYLGKTIRPDYHERITNLLFFAETALEFKLPLNLIGDPESFRMQVGSWNDVNCLSDDMIDFNWITYTVSSN